MKVISVKFKESGRAYYFDPKELEIKEGEFVIVETARGVECGEVVRSAHEIAAVGFAREIKPVIRRTAWMCAACARTVRTRKPPLNCAKSALPPISCR